MKALLGAMFVLLILALSGQSTHADEWRPFAANPAYEVYGHTDPFGVFVYTQSRPKAVAAPMPKKPSLAKNFGVNLPKHEPVLTASDFEVRGTDPALSKAMAEAAIKVEADAPCPGPGPCPNRPRPQPKPEPHVPHVVPAAITGDAIVVVMLVILGCFIGFAILAIKLLIIFLVLRWLWRKLVTPPDPVGS